MKYIKILIASLLFTCCVKLIPKQLEKSGFGRSESSRDSTIVSCPILEIWGNLRSLNPGALARPKSQFFKLFGYTAQNAFFPPLLVSLGCSCEVAHELRWNGKRDRAFPFDWLLTTDCAKFVSLLEDDFKFFLDRRYLLIGNTNKTFIFNSYYNIEFRHDLYDIDTTFEDHLPLLEEKYRRRIERFRDLGTYPGKVYFIRSAYPPGYDHAQSIVTKECLALTYAHAEALKNALTHLFPNLDFDLIIINYEAAPCPKIVGLDRVVEFKIGTQRSFADVLKELYHTRPKSWF